MGEIVNLRHVRKSRARAGEEAKASANRAVFGRSKTEKATADAEKARAERRLDSHRLDEHGGNSS